MNYLMVVSYKNGEAVESYHKLVAGEEQRLTRLIRNKALPPRWNLRGSEIVTDDILGFTDNPTPTKQKLNVPKITNFDDLRKWAKNQKWYRGAESSSSVQPPQESGPSQPQSERLQLRF